MTPLVMLSVTLRSTEVQCIQCSFTYILTGRVIEFVQEAEIFERTLNFYHPQRAFACNACL